jgi:hypothetical protein
VLDEKMAEAGGTNEMEVVGHNDEETMAQKERQSMKALSEASPSTVEAEGETGEKMMSRMANEIDLVHD